MRRALIAAAAGLASLIAANAFVVDHAGIGQPIKWNLLPPFDTEGISTNVVNPVTRAVRYYLGSQAWSATNRVNELNALRASFAQWQATPGTLLKFEDAGLVGPGVDVDTFDNTNVVFFAKTPLVNGGRDNISGQTGRAFLSWWADNNQLAEVDIVLNGFEFRWSTDIFATSSSAFFVEGVALHEIGHMIGLFHTPSGAGTMFHAGEQGLANLQTGLSEDEWAGARALYPQPSAIGTFGHLRGQVTLGGAPVLGAAVFAEDSAGNLSGATVTRADGLYDLSYLPTGSYRVRAAPLDPTGAANYLARGKEISQYFETNAVNSSFLPTAGQVVNLAAGISSTVNLAVTGGTPAFRITHIRTPATNANFLALVRAPVALRPGQSNYLVGVYGPSLPTSGATLSVTGDGLTIGAPIFSPNVFPGTNLISALVTVSTQATPGLRSFVVTRSGDGATAWAHGFLEIQPLVPDVNFDGLDDYFQRRWFPLFTAPEAGPAADPDGDLYSNLQEYQGGQSNPTSAASIPSITIDRVTLTPTGSTVVWRTVVGKRYQLQGRAHLGGAVWQGVGEAITATGTTTQAFDSTATNQMRFYRVQLVP